MDLVKTENGENSTAATVDNNGPNNSEDHMAPQPTNNSSSPIVKTYLSEISSDSGSEIEIIEKEEREQIIFIDESSSGSVSTKFASEEESPRESHFHPYLHLLDNFKPTEEQLLKSPITEVISLAGTPLVQVSTSQDLFKMVHELRTCKEIAVNAHYEIEKYQNRVTVIEISSRKTDYLIDAVKLRNDLLLLAEIFLNPSIVKIVHRSENILSCLQHSLRIFFVNLFDAYQAARVFSQGCKNFTKTVRNLYKFETKFNEEALNVQKWRLSRLDDPLRDYYRHTSHYLIYYYDHYKNKLIDKDMNMLREVIKTSNEQCKIIYNDPAFQNYNELVKEFGDRHECQFSLLESLYKWRDQVARNNNVHPSSVLTKAELGKLIIQLPKNDKEITSIISSKIARKKKKKEELLNIIRSAKTKYNVKTYTFLDDQIHSSKGSVNRKRSLKNKPAENGDAKRAKKPFQRAWRYFEAENQKKVYQTNVRIPEYRERERSQNQNSPLPDSFEQTLGALEKAYYF